MRSVCVFIFKRRIPSVKYSCLIFLSIDALFIQLRKIFLIFVVWHIYMYMCTQMMVQATMAVYKSAVAHFLPTPSKSHYVFNLRDFSRVVRGVLLVPKTHLAEGDKLMRLWVHEVYRVFYDRLIDDQDRCLYI